MKTGDIVFLKDEFFERFPNQPLMLNKPPTADGNKHRRPYLIALQDKQNQNVFWAVPFSSRIQKYSSKYQNAINKYGRCDSIRFGIFNNKMNAFLLQNMCPIIPKYVEEPYQNEFGKPYRLSDNLTQNISKTAQKILSKAEAGIKLSFTNLIEMRETLQNELSENFSFYDDTPIPEPKKEKNLSRSENPIQSFCEKWAKEHNQNELDSDLADDQDVEI